MKAAQACCQVALRSRAAARWRAMGALLRGASTASRRCARRHSPRSRKSPPRCASPSTRGPSTSLRRRRRAACETDAQAAAAAHILSLLLRQLGRDALTTLDARQLRACTARLRELRARAADDLVREHADAALEQLRLLGAALIFPASERRGLEIRMP